MNGEDNNTAQIRLEAKLGFDRVRKAISDRCSTDYAVERVASEDFISDPVLIRKRLLLTDEMRLILMFEDSFPTSGYIDCLPFLTNLQNRNANIDLLSLGKLRTMCDTVHRVTLFFEELKGGIYPNLQKLSKSVISFPEVQRRIDTILDRYGEVKDTASDTLHSIRKALNEKTASISRKAAAILKKAQEEGIVDPELGVSVRDGKYLIPVSSANKRKLDGFIYDESASGKTTFIEPAGIVALENEISELRCAEEREIAHILHEFSEFVRPYLPELKDSAVFVGEMDFLMAKAGTALDYIAGVPVISECGEMNLRKARHPLLEKSLAREGREMVPLSVTLSPKKHILLISGPNAGGKSVCLKTVGLLQYMFQWGMLIPTSEASEMCVFDRIMLSIGDDQSIENDLSTYSSFLTGMKDMLAVADSKTLVLIDEFGSGTEPAAGGAIAEAILEEIDRRGVYGVITTHYTNLKLYAAGADCGVINGAMLFDSRNIEPLFKMETGLPGNSFAFELARKTGLPEHIVKDAEEKVGREYVGIERNLRKIARNRRVLDEKLQKIKSTDKVLEDITDKYQKELLDIRRQKKEILSAALSEAEDIVKDANRRVENTIKEIRESNADREQTMEARKQLQKFISALQERKTGDESGRDEYIDRKMEQIAKRRSSRHPARTDRGEGANQEISREPVKMGEKVRVKSNGMVGEVSKVSDKSVTVVIGNVFSKLPLDRVERISSNEFKSAFNQTSSAPLQVVDSSIQERKLHFKTELDVRGERLNDALDIVTRYVDDAIMLNMSSVRIIHGKGSGVLRDEIQKFLKTMPGVDSVRDEDIQLGGTGVTIVTFD
ncbi:MAG: Smr/MutS family protein [Bacteroidales bacterium]|nr:Smr/MutS family protein [Bacteroidales bacterium]